MPTAVEYALIKGWHAQNGCGSGPPHKVTMAQNGGAAGPPALAQNGVGTGPPAVEHSIPITMGPVPGALSGDLVVAGPLAVLVMVASLAGALRRRLTRRPGR